MVFLCPRVKSLIDFGTNGFGDTPMATMNNAVIDLFLVLNNLCSEADKHASGYWE